MQITTVGLDLAKNVIQVHAVNQHGKAVLKKSLKRDQVLPFFANLTPCLIGIEACSSAHYWARKLQTLGHTVRLMAPQFVKPYVKTNKNDAADAEASSFRPASHQPASSKPGAVQPEPIMVDAQSAHARTGAFDRAQVGSASFVIRNALRKND